MSFARKTKLKPMIDPRDYLLPGGYILFVPGTDTAKPNRIMLYDVVEMLRARERTEFLEGHPEIDLPEWAWGAVDYSVSRVRRWVERGFLIKARLNADGNRWIIRRCEPKEWRTVLSDEDYHWLIAYCQASEVYRQQTLAEQAQPEPKPEPKAPKSKKKRLKAKERRRRARRERLEAAWPET